MADRPVVIVSNRGPLSFRRDEAGELVARRGAGGLVSGLAPLVVGTPTVWLAAAMSDADRDAAATGTIEAEGFRVRTLSIDPDDYRSAYQVIANGTLWFVHHGLFDHAREPVIDEVWRRAWEGYRRTNEAFAEAVAEEAPDGAAVLVQDLHLALLAPRLHELRPDVETVHFSHTPFARPEELEVLPEEVRHELLGAMARFGSCGFHTERWATAFNRCCQDNAVPPPRTFVSPLAPDPDDLASTLRSEACQVAGRGIDAELDGRRFVVRVDRIELSKNLLRGFRAFDELLARYPQWREQVVFGAYVYPSREGLENYRRYRSEVEALVEQVNERWGTAGWRPVLYDPSDDHPRSVAALRRADVLLVNPIRDGLNLVAMEGVLASDRCSALVLGTGAGAWDLLGDDAFDVNPYDVSATADRLHEALSLDADARRDHHRALQKVVAARTPADWLADQLRATG